MPPLLSKSAFLKGRQCSRRLWLAAHDVAEPEVEPEDLWEEREMEGDAVEALAEQLFTGATQIGARGVDEGTAVNEPTLNECLAQTRSAIAARRVVFQAYLCADDLLALTDILEPSGNGWFLWEVKASTSDRPMNDWDLGFQWTVAERMGLDVVGAGLLLLDGNYERGTGAIQPSELLRRIDLTARVQAVLPAVRTEVDRQLRLIAAEMPNERPATRCKGSISAKEGNRPSHCGHLAAVGVCGSQLPAHWAGRLPRLQGKKADSVYALEDQSIERLRTNAPDLKWTDDQARCIDAVTTGQVVLDRTALARELETLQWPVAYVDFEFDPGMAVPLYPACRPYDRLPFQWSMLVQEEEGGPVLEREPFLHLDVTDPRLPFAESLLAALPNEGSIVAHHASAETTVITQLATRLGGEIEHRLRALVERFRDTEVLARAGYCHQDQHGSWSIKKLAPALLGRGYEHLTIQNGMAAVVAWRQACRETDRGVRDRLRAGLHAYCGRDTRLMHDIVERLRGMAAEAL